MPAEWIPLAVLAVKLIARANDMSALADSIEDAASSTSQVWALRKSRQGARMYEDLRRLLAGPWAHEYREHDEGDLRSASIAVEASVRATFITADETSLGRSSTILVAEVMAGVGSIHRRELMSPAAQDCFDFLIRAVLVYMSRQVRASDAFHGAGINKSLAIQLELADMVAELQRHVARLPLRAGTRYPLAAARRYLAGLDLLVDHLDLPGVDIDPKAAVLSLHATHVPIALRDVSGRARRPTASLYAPGRRVLIIGGAGSGKTTMLKHLASQIARESWDAESVGDLRVPFLVKARRVRVEDPATSIHEQAFATAFTPPGGVNWTTEMIELGRAVLLIDGIDELPAEDAVVLASFLDEAHAASAPKPLTIVATCRDELRVAMPSSWDRYWLEPLTTGARADLVYRLSFGIARTVNAPQDVAALTASKLIQRLVETPPLNALSGNPLMCAVAFMLFRDSPDSLPQDTSHLFEGIVQMLLWFRDAERRLFTPNPVPLPILRAVAEALAWQVQSSQLKPIPWREAVTASNKVLAGTRMPGGYEVRSGLVLEALERRASLLRRTVDDLLEFTHSAFREYLAGQYAIRVGYTECLPVLQRAESDTVLSWVLEGSLDSSHSDLFQLVLEVDGVSLSNRPRGALCALLSGHAASECHEEERVNLASILVPPESPAEVAALARTPVAALAAITEFLESIESQRQAGRQPITARNSLRLLIDTLLSIGTNEALDTLRHMLSRFGEDCDRRIIQGWARAPSSEYSSRVLIPASTMGINYPLELELSAELAALDLLPPNRRVHLCMPGGRSLDGCGTSRRLEDVRLGPCTWSELTEFLTRFPNIVRLTVRVADSAASASQEIPLEGVLNLRISGEPHYPTLGCPTLGTDEFSRADQLASLVIDGGIELLVAESGVWALPGRLHALELRGTGFFGSGGRLASLTLESLAVDDMPYGDVPGLGLMPRLSKLSLAGAPATSGSALAALPSLTHLDVSSTGFESLESLVECPALVEVIVDDGQLDELPSDAWFDVFGNQGAERALKERPIVRSTPDEAGPDLDWEAMTLGAPATKQQPPGWLREIYWDSGIFEPSTSQDTAGTQLSAHQGRVLRERLPNFKETEQPEGTEPSVSADERSRRFADRFSAQHKDIQELVNRAANARSRSSGSDPQQPGRQQPEDDPR